jgi:hypothetical protein
MSEDYTLEEVRRMAADAGLTNLTEAHLQELSSAAAAARQRRAALPFAQLAPADEPATVLSMEAEGGR